MISQFIFTKRRIWTGAAAVCMAWAITGAAHCESVDIQNAGLEDPKLNDIENASFDGVFGAAGKVPGWTSNEPSKGGALHFNDRFPGRTGENVLYLHGSEEQNFHTQDFDLGEELKSDTTYVFTVDVLRWNGVTADDSVDLRVGVYSGEDYESRKPLKEFAGRLQLVDKNNNPADKVTLVLVFTTGKVAPGTKFWIGGDANGNADDRYRAHFDNFALFTETK